MKIEAHLRNVKESIEAIEEAIEKGIENKQRTIGFKASAACADMFEILLHKKNLLSQDALVKHEWFASKNKMKEKFNFEFEGKEELLSLMSEIETKRNILCYGKKQSLTVIQEVIDLFNQVKEKMKEFEVLDENK
jgi:hypothetical protein